ncbi:unnamed protein product, partial [marine sediment metagenome]
MCPAEIACSNSAIFFLSVLNGNYDYLSNGFPPTYPDG